MGSQLELGSEFEKNHMILFGDSFILRKKHMIIRYVFISLDFSWWLWCDSDATNDGDATGKYLPIWGLDWLTFSRIFRSWTHEPNPLWGYLGRTWDNMLFDLEGPWVVVAMMGYEPIEGFKNLLVDPSYKILTLEQIGDIHRGKATKEHQVYPNSFVQSSV